MARNIRDDQGICAKWLPSSRRSDWPISQTCVPTATRLPPGKSICLGSSVVGVPMQNQRSEGQWGGPDQSRRSRLGLLGDQWHQAASRSKRGSSLVHLLFALPTGCRVQVPMRSAAAAAPIVLASGPAVAPRRQFRHHIRLRSTPSVLAVRFPRGPAQLRLESDRGLLPADVARFLARCWLVAAAATSLLMRLALAAAVQQALHPAWSALYARTARELNRPKHVAGH